MEAILTARKHRGVEQVFAFINRHMLKRHFHQIWATGLEPIITAPNQQPIIFYANHSNWWDGLIAFYLSYDLLKLDAYLMMLARQLKKYHFFRWIGAFSVESSLPISAYRSLQYAASLLDHPSLTPRRGLWLFSQGELLPNDIRPLNFMRGLAWLAARLPQAQLVSVAFRYEFLNEQLPEAFLSLAAPMDIDATLVQDRQNFTDQLQQRLTAQLDQLKENVVNQCTSNFQPILKGGISLNIAYERALKLFKKLP